MTNVRLDGPGIFMLHTSELPFLARSAGDAIECRCRMNVRSGLTAVI